MLTITEAFEQHQSYLLGMAYRMTGNYEDAADLVSVMWVRVLPHWARLEDNNLMGYLRRVLMNLNNDRSHLRYTVSIDSSPDWADNGQPYSNYIECPISIDTIVESRDQLRRVLVLIKTMPPYQQRAIAGALAYGNRERTNATYTSGQRSALSHARKKLREAV